MTEPDAATVTGPTFVRCPGCAAPVPDIEGPTHAYMQASPGCWAVYGQVVARAVHAGSPVPGGHHVDCYAVQHPGGADTDRRQRHSVAVHLTTLCLLLEHAQPLGRASALRGRMTTTVLPVLGLAEWPYLSPPAERGSITAAHLHAVEDPAELAEGLQAWAESAWSAWAGHHQTVRLWAAAALRGRR